MTVNLAYLRECDLDYRGNVEAHSAAEDTMEMLPAIIRELDRLRRLEAAVLEHVESCGECADCIGDGQRLLASLAEARAAAKEVDRG